jgi:hypothetical protein
MLVQLVMLEMILVMLGLEIMFKIIMMPEPLLIQLLVQMLLGILFLLLMGMLQFMLVTGGL